MKTRHVIILGVIGAAVLLYATNMLGKTLKKVASLPGQFGSAAGLTLYEWTHKGEGAALVAPSYVVTFPDGARHSVGSQYLTTDNRFKWQGVEYRMMRDTAGKPYAVPV